MKPCPFCGGSSIEAAAVRCTSEVFYGYVECECGAVKRADQGTVADAIAAWNTRPEAVTDEAELIAAAKRQVQEARDTLNSAIEKLVDLHVSKVSPLIVGETPARRD